jgi:hypothetical protein
MKIDLGQTLTILAILVVVAGIRLLVVLWGGPGPRHRGKHGHFWAGSGGLEYSGAKR